MTYSNTVGVADIQGVSIILQDAAMAIEPK